MYYFNLQVPNQSQTTLGTIGHSFNNNGSKAYALGNIDVASKEKLRFLYCEACRELKTVRSKSCWVVSTSSDSRALFVTEEVLSRKNVKLDIIRKSVKPVSFEQDGILEEEVFLRVVSLPHAARLDQELFVQYDLSLGLAPAVWTRAIHVL